MTKHYNIPIFISHFGCPNSCVFCNQKKINGVETDITTKDIENIIEQYLKTLPKHSTKELAFFGGTFTGLSIELQKKYLAVVKKYIDKKIIDGIRISTRPECIDRDILETLKFYGVKTIELGVQSLDKKVLLATGRNYDFEIVKKSSEIIKEYGFSLGIQLMVGLPYSSLESDIDSAKKTILLKPDIARIYPTLVIKDTELEKMYKNKIYQELSMVEAIERSKEVYKILSLANINVIRIGLQASEDLQGEGNIIAGPFHPAFRELVEQSIYFDLFYEIYSKEKKLNIITNEKNVSKIVGQNKKNKKYFYPNFNFSIDNSLNKDLIIINEKEFKKEDILKKRV